MPDHIREPAGATEDSMTDTTTQKAVGAIANQIANFIGSRIDGPFRVIRYPPGFNYFVEYSQPVYFNPKTLALIDQLCTVDARGVASLSGSSFSGLYARILGNVDYAQSAADAAASAALAATFDAATDAMVAAFEKSFGAISAANVAACRPPTKLAYADQYAKANFPGDPPAIPPIYATFARAYMQVLGLGRQVETDAARQIDAQQMVAAAENNTTSPVAANGGRQIADGRWGVAYTGLPDNGTITASLTSTAGSVTVGLVLEQDAPATMRLTLDDQPIGSLAQGDLEIGLAPQAGAKARPIDDLWATATTIEMAIAYSGLTVLRADPAPLSTDLSTGWYSRAILSEIATKTGSDATGLHLQGSAFSTAALFGAGKTFARVRTFVISQEPTVTLRFHGTDTSSLDAQFGTAQPAEIELGGILSLGKTSEAFSVLGTTRSGDVTEVVLGPPAPVGTTPERDRTAHIIGGVVEFPPFGS